MAVEAVQQCAYDEFLDREVVVSLKNSRYLMGSLKSYDQYNSISLDRTIERVYTEKEYAEKKQGLVVIRGENILYIALGKAPVPATLRRTTFDLLQQSIKNAEQK